MPRVFSKTKNRGGHKTYRCNVCGEDIQPGEDYYTWKFNRGARFYRHTSHGMPPRGQLTNSKMGAVYDAVDGFSTVGCESADDIKQELESVASVAREVAAEYGESADNQEQAFPSGTPTSEACRTTAQELESWADTLESWEPDIEFVDTVADSMQEWLDQCKDEAQALMDDQPEYQG